MAGPAESFVVVDSEPPPSRLSMVKPVAFSIDVPLNRDTNQLQLLPVDVGNLPPPSRKHLFVVAACIFFLLVNSEAQNYYVRYSETSRMAEGNGTYLLCWFSSIFQIIIYPLHMLAVWTYRRLQTCCDKGARELNGRELAPVNVLADRFREPKRFLLCCLGLNVLNFLGTYTWYLSLGMLPVSFNFVASKASVVFSYAPLPLTSALLCVLFDAGCAGTCCRCQF